MPTKSRTVPKALQPLYEDLVKLTDAVCKKHLDQEYAELARDMLAALARKRPSPLSRGRAEGWACAVLYALGSVNFLFDRTQQPHLPAKELCALFGVSPSNASAKARDIERMLRIRTFDPEWYRPSQLQDNPVAWLFETREGLILDARYVPRDLQEALHAMGVIPFVPSTSMELE
jgi:hypothetical protein